MDLLLFFKKKTKTKSQDPNADNSKMKIVFDSSGLREHLTYYLLYAEKQIHCRIDKYYRHISVK